MPPAGQALSRCAAGFRPGLSPRNDAATIIRTLDRCRSRQRSLDWAATEGWNPGLDDAAAFQAADPDGFLGAFVDGEMVAGISAVAYDDRFRLHRPLHLPPGCAGRAMARRSGTPAWRVSAIARSASTAWSRSRPTTGAGLHAGLQDSPVQRAPGRPAVGAERLRTVTTKLVPTSSPMTRIAFPRPGARSCSVAAAAASCAGGVSPGDHGYAVARVAARASRSGRCSPTTWRPRCT